MSDASTLFLQMVADELARARRTHLPIHSLHEGYAVILEELDEFKAEVWKKTDERNAVAMCGELVQIAAMCARVVVDVLHREVEP